MANAGLSGVADHSSPAAVAAAVTAGCDFAPCVSETGAPDQNDTSLSDLALVASIFAHLHRLHDAIASAASEQSCSMQLDDLISTQQWLPTALKLSRRQENVAGLNLRNWWPKASSWMPCSVKQVLTNPRKTAAAERPNVRLASTGTTLCHPQRCLRKRMGGSKSCKLP